MALEMRQQIKMTQQLVMTPQLQREHQAAPVDPYQTSGCGASGAGGESAPRGSWRPPEEGVDSESVDAPENEKPEPPAEADEFREVETER